MYPVDIVRGELAEMHVTSAVELQMLVMPNPWSEQAFKSSINAGHGCYSLTRGKFMVAVAVVSQVVDEAELLTIAVAKQEQGKGLATVFLHDLLAILKRQSAKQCMLEVMESNIAAITLYYGMGFRQIAKRKAYYKTKHGTFDAIVMRLDF
jgi:ribosomal-protein-alanine N-acetyltransferase